MSIAVYLDGDLIADATGVQQWEQPDRIDTSTVDRISSVEGIGERIVAIETRTGLLDFGEDGRMRVLTVVVGGRSIELRGTAHHVPERTYPFPPKPRMLSCFFVRWVTT